MKVDLPDDRQEDARRKALLQARQRRQILPEDHRRDAENDARRQHRRDDDQIIERAGAAIDLRHHDSAGEADRHRNRDHACRR